MALTLDQTNRPPYVEWKRRSVEDRNASIAAGHYVARDEDFAIIMRPGSKDTVEKPAEVFLKELADKARTNPNDIPADWPMKFRQSYEFWKNGEAEPLQGTSIKAWPAISPAQADMIIRAGIRTVEDLAGLPDSEVGILGVGGISLKQKARSWLEAAADKGVLAAKNAALETQVADLQTQNKSLMEGFAELKAQVAALQGAKK